MSLRTSVLLVDDNPDIVFGLGRFLERAGCAVSSCADGDEAIALLEANDFQMVITDVQMPRVNGITVVEWVREHKPQTRMVVMTAFGSPKVCTASLRKGAVLYLEKPVDPMLIRALIFSEKVGSGFRGAVDELDLVEFLPRAENKPTGS
jgi:DNA-binding NtrC family response regulator